MPEDVQISEIKQLLKELAISQKETDAKFKATDVKFKETDSKFKATDVKFKETDSKFKETDAKFRETDQRIKKAFDLFEGQWGRLMESLVQGDIVNLLRQRNINITDTSTRRSGFKNGEHFEFDIIAHNSDEIVIIEVKTTLRVKHVKKLVDRLTRIDRILPEYKDYKVYGAVAFLEAVEESATFAERQKLFVIKATGDSASIINSPEFVPKPF